MNNSKKLFLLIGALSMLLTACGSNNSSPNDDGTKTDNYYTVIWKNYDNSVLEIDNNVKEGTMPHYDSGVPTKPEDDNYTHILGTDGLQRLQA